jgi:leucyl-tRNA synthetase
MKQYDHKKIEKKWQKKWDDEELYKAQDTSDKPSFYSLIEFPFPSGQGMHTGHLRSNTAMDIVSRKRRGEGYNVIFPIGWDAFGLPTENYAIKTGLHPSIVTKTNTDTFRKQLKSAGFSFDWSREVNTTDPEYYRWTQWIFLQMFKEGLAYKKKMFINWCPKDKIGLANEEVIDGKCERCGTPVEKREKDQWMLAITKYADRLDKDLDTVDYLEKIKIQQRNWIGRSEGVNFKCKIKDLGIEVEMYNSVPQTYRAETFTVIAPDHHLVPKLIEGMPQADEVRAFVKKIQEKKAANKFDVEKDMEGIFTGRYIENFAGTGRDLPIWIASYVVSDYGTGIVNASAHDLRDYAFAKKFNIPLREVAEPLIVEKHGEDAFRSGEPVVERNAIVAVVKHWSEDKYLCLAWKKNDWKGFVVGGIEGDENIEDAARREIIEETGYKNPKFVKQLGGIVHSKFYQAVKKQNRFAHFTPVLFQLENGDHDEINEDEKALHELVWKNKDEIANYVNRDDMRLIWDRCLGIDRPIIKNGILIEPDEFKGREWSEVRKDIIDYLVKNNFAERKVNYKLRDWVFSRQRYWGEPIPMVYCEACAAKQQDKANPGWIPVPEKDLPVTLPDVKQYEPTDTGESPLATMTEWVTTTCPDCGGPARRETDTMPNWAGSSWYFLRYIDPKNTKVLADKKLLEYWMPVDWYNGGMEHTTLHLLYSRFWNKFLFDIGVVPTSEPYQKRTSHGLILAEDGEKMSKSRGNVVAPDDIIENYGADTLRLYEMFMGPFDQAVAWSTAGIIGPRRFLEKVWRLAEKVVKREPTAAEASLESTIQKTLKKVSADIEGMQFNTAVSAMMIAANELEKASEIPQKLYEIYLQMLAPFAPHITDELWADLGHEKSIHTATWPLVDESKITAQGSHIVVQVNGKIRAEFDIETGVSDEALTEMAKSHEGVTKWVEGKEIKKVIVVKNKLVNIVVV